MLKMKTAPPILDEKVLIETYRGLSEVQRQWLWTTLLFAHALPYQTTRQVCEFIKSHTDDTTD